MPTIAATPPRFVRLSAHPLRWGLLSALVESDRTVRELTELVGEPQNLVSYHLGQLRDAGLVNAHRSSFDGRDRYYSVDLASCREQFCAAGGELHPALGLAPLSTPPVEAKRVLFLCTGNSARSQIAEALAVELSDGAFDARSAGSAPKPLHSGAVRVMQTRGIDISANRTKHLDELLGERFDAVITLCDRVREVCPEFPAQPRSVHWSIPDPTRADEGDIDAAFERVTAELEIRIHFLLYTLDAKP
jgi:protein-tyrosine-phosphatase